MRAGSCSSPTCSLRAVQIALCQGDVLALHQGQHLQRPSPLLRSPGRCTRARSRPAARGRARARPAGAAWAGWLRLPSCPWGLLSSRRHLWQQNLLAQISCLRPCQLCQAAAGSTATETVAHSEAAAHQQHTCSHGRLHVHSAPPFGRRLADGCVLRDAGLHSIHCQPMRCHANLHRRPWQGLVHLLHHPALIRVVVHQVKRADLPHLAEAQLGVVSEEDGGLCGQALERRVACPGEAIGGLRWKQVGSAMAWCMQASHVSPLHS